jgi:flagellar assembly protein FliH
VVEPLRYLSPAGEDAAESEAQETEAVAGQEWAARLAAKDAEWKARCEAVRQEALAQGRTEVEGRRMELLTVCAGQWSRAVEEFRQSQELYFVRVEREVVELSLAIAARILQREAQVDPLLLSGAVRVALGQLQESTTVELRVPTSAREMWVETLRLMPNLPVVPRVVADSEMKDGECVLTTEAGRVDLGVKAQLKEVERGFFDLLSHRVPASGRDAARVGL